MHYTYCDFGFKINKPEWGRKIRNTILEKGLDIGKKQFDELKQAARRPDSYRRGALSAILNRVNPKRNQFLNEALLDLDDLTQNGDKMLNRREFLKQGFKRSTRRLNPIKDPETHDTMEQIKDTIDTLAPKKPPKNTNMSRYNYMCAEFMLLPTLAQAGVSGLLYGGTYVGAKQLSGEKLNDEQAKREMIANTAGAVASGTGGFLVLKALAKKGLA